MSQNQKNILGNKIFNKNVKNVFHIDSESTCSLIHCSIDNKDKTGPGTFDISLIGSNSFTNGLTFISTGDCVNIFEKSYYKSKIILYRNILFIIVFFG